MQTATRNLSTPWGQADSHKRIAEGIEFFSTPSHGGYLLSDDRRQAMPDRIRDFATFAGGNWFEEDCDAALVAYSFPEVFGAEESARAERFIRAWKPALLAK